ncbi:UNKNOWN [Stylonychia lemnae]|uniref:Uncharacterized protein n=1 Tax=Stylonychia lemnae TaxID=5949 RepID=A0A078B158_STYLE|nr:UNKNOWN [Stylonychia lemnae]|eukprot:CDW86843.1 UNKNOWN [Stylonychia lemnae]
MQTLDHIDEDKVTWAEFMNWLSKEGTIRNIANDQRLYAFTITRIEEEQEYLMRQMQVQKLASLNVEDNFNFVLLVYENREVVLASQNDLNHKVFQFKFSSRYQKPKRISEYPLYKQRKMRPQSAANYSQSNQSRRIGNMNPARRRFQQIQESNMKIEIQNLENDLVELKSTSSRNVGLNSKTSLNRDDLKEGKINMYHTMDTTNHDQSLISPNKNSEMMNMTIGFNSSGQKSEEELSVSTQSKYIIQNLNYCRNNRRKAYDYNISRKAKKIRPYQVLGITDTTQENDEIRELLKMQEQNQIDKGKKNLYFHTFGIDDRLFTPKLEQNKNKRNFQGLMKVMENIIEESDTKLNNMKILKKYRNSMLQPPQYQINASTITISNNEESIDHNSIALQKFQSAANRNQLSISKEQSFISNAKILALSQKKSVDVNQLTKHLSLHFKQNLDKKQQQQQQSNDQTRNERFSSLNARQRSKQFHKLRGQQQTIKLSIQNYLQQLKEIRQLIRVASRYRISGPG